MGFVVYLCDPAIAQQNPYKGEVVMSETILKVQGVSKVFYRNKHRAVNNVSFNVSKGETIAIVGNRAAERQRSGTV